MPLDIYWSLNGKKVESDDGISINRNGRRISVMSIDSVQAVHRGNYSCIAINNAGKAVHSAFVYVNGTITLLNYRICCEVPFSV